MGFRGESGIEIFSFFKVLDWSEQNFGFFCVKKTREPLGKAEKFAEEMSKIGGKLRGECLFGDNVKDQKLQKETFRAFQSLFADEDDDSEDDWMKSKFNFFTWN